MIKKSELRIGNWIYCGGVGMKLISQKDLSRVESTKCNPIPLSTGFRKGVGFQETSEIWEFAINPKIQLKYDNFDVLLYFDKMPFGGKASSIHELQNKLNDLHSLEI